MRSRKVLVVVGIALTLAVLAGVVGLFFFREPAGDPRLAAFVSAKPAVAVVFTSRTDPSSFRAASAPFDPSSSPFGGTGQPQWQATEGRLRVLTPSGQVRELTWEKPLPDGGTLVDVMSPSVTVDGKTVVFAGRQADADGGRFRVYSVNLDGSNLQQRTGGPDDPGCVALPPLRFTTVGGKLPDDARKRIDYDDLDPLLLPNGVLVFASSRLPDTGGRDRRATQIWIQESGKPARTLSANRANDRWPSMTAARMLMFSVWSKQDEVVSADGTGLVRLDPPAAGLTAPSDRWMAVRITLSAESFSIAAKVLPPVWRPRAVGNGRITFMTSPPGRPTPFTPENEHPETGRLRVASAAYGQVSSAPSSLAADTPFPEQAEPGVLWAPATTSDGRTWSMATPSPLPADRVLVSAAPMNGSHATPATYGLYTLPQADWSADTSAVGDFTLLFDDPEFVDAEPVAVVTQTVDGGPILPPMAWPAEKVNALTLLTGPYTGPTGELHAEQLTTNATGEIPGNVASGGAAPVVPLYPPGGLSKIAFYASHRDRFDDPIQPVVRGTFEKLLEVAVSDRGSVRATMPVGSPTLLVGLGPDGKVASATGAADAKGTRGKFYAFAGDHVSGTRPGGYHFCTGCHAGHTFPGGTIVEPGK